MDPFNSFIAEIIAQAIGGILCGLVMIWLSQRYSRVDSKGEPASPPLIPWDKVLQFSTLAGLVLIGTILITFLLVDGQRSGSLVDLKCIERGILPLTLYVGAAVILRAYQIQQTRLQQSVLNRASRNPERWIDYVQHNCMTDNGQELVQKHALISGILIGISAILPILLLGTLVSTPGDNGLLTCLLVASLGLIVLTYLAIHDDAILDFLVLNDNRLVGLGATGSLLIFPAFLLPLRLLGGLGAIFFSALATGLTVLTWCLLFIIAFALGDWFSRVL